MKLAQLFNSSIILEGMIKLPVKLHTKLLKEVRTLCLSYSFARLEKAAAAYKVEPVVKELAISEFNAFFAKKYPDIKVIKKFNPSQARAWRKIGDFSNDDLDPSYRKLMKLGGIDYEWGEGKPLSLNVHIQPGNTLNKYGNSPNSNVAGVYRDDDNIIDINVSPIRQWSWELYFTAAKIAVDKGNARQAKAHESMLEILARLNDKISHIDGLVDHELTHYIQFKVIGRGHEQQIQNTGRSHAEPGSHQSNTDSYYSSQIEFDPQIKSAIANIVTSINRLKRKLKRDFNWHVLARVAVGELSHDEAFEQLKLDDNALVVEPLHFFTTLKRVDQVKWRKAVKLFIAGIEAKLKTSKGE
jgi:hypothetical protein